MNKSRWMLVLSKAKIPIILILILCLFIGSMTPTINSILIENNDELKEKNGDDDNEEMKQSDYYDNYVHASFYWSPKYPDPGEKITFQSSSYASNGHVTSHTWSFEDGSSTKGRTATQTYNEKGSFTVTLTVWGYGWVYDYTTDKRRYYTDWDTTTRTIIVGGDPFPEITCTPEYPNPGEEVTLDASNSHDPDGEIMTFNWSVYNVENPGNITYLGSTKIITHIFSEQGIFNVKLFIEDNKGNNNTFEKAITVSILKLSGFSKRSRGLTFKIENLGNFTAENVNYNVEIVKYKRLGIFERTLYSKTKTISTIDSNSYETVQLKDIRRRFCKVRVTVTVEGDNALMVSKSFYGLIFLKSIYLYEEDFINPYFVLLAFGIVAVFILSILSQFS